MKGSQKAIRFVGQSAVEAGALITVGTFGDLLFDHEVSWTMDELVYTVMMIMMFKGVGTAMQSWHAKKVNGRVVVQPGEKPSSLGSTSPSTASSNTISSGSASNISVNPAPASTSRISSA